MALSTSYNPRFNFEGTRLRVGTKISKVSQWCAKNISPQAYYFSSGGLRMGGYGWEICSKDGGYYLYIEDEKMLSFALLTI